MDPYVKLDDLEKETLLGDNESEIDPYNDDGDTDGTF